MDHRDDAAMTHVLKKFAVIMLIAVLGRSAR